MLQKYLYAPAWSRWCFMYPEFENNVFPQVSHDLYGVSFDFAHDDMCDVNVSMAEMSKVLPQTHDSWSAVTMFAVADMSMPYTESGSSPDSSSIRHLVRSSGREIRFSGSVMVVSNRSSKTCAMYSQLNFKHTLCCFYSKFSWSDLYD